MSVGGKYRLTRELGEGGMGAVWAAVHEKLNRSVAVKFLRPQQIADAQLAERFIAEARIAAAVKHRFVVETIDCGATESGLPYMVLELLGGNELSRVIQDGPPLAVKDAVRFVAQCLSGLDAVHRAGIVHRDLKPENIFLISDSDGIFPKLLDFGIALMSAASESDAALPASGKRLTQGGATVGTPTYMSPEQLRARRDLDARADLYSMGVILFELLTGRVPFVQDNAADLLLAILSQRAPRLRDVRPELGQTLSDVLQRAMAPDREQRFASAAEMRKALLGLLPELPDAQTIAAQALPNAGFGLQTKLLFEAAVDPFGMAPADRLVARRRKLWLAAAAGLVALAGLVAALLAGGDEPSPAGQPGATAASQVVNEAPSAVAAPRAAQTRGADTVPAPRRALTVAPVVSAQPAADQPAAAQVAPQPAPAVASDAAGQPGRERRSNAGTAVSGVRTEHPSGRRATATGARTAPAPTRARSAVAPEKKLVRRLDF